MKNLLFYTSIVLFALAPEAMATSFNFTSYYPAPIGNYSNIQLNPQTALATSNCDIGTFYVNSSNNNLPYYCAPGSPSSQFQLITGVWTLSGNNLYPSALEPLPLCGNGAINTGEQCDDGNLNNGDACTENCQLSENSLLAIGSTTPVFKLTLENDGGILSDNTSTSYTALPAGAQGAGTRLVFYPSQRAFRAGYASGTEWDTANLGQNSTAMGYGNKASGIESTVLGGKGNSTSGNYSFISGGLNNISIGQGSNIIGGANNSINSASQYHVVGGFTNSVTCTQNACSVLGGSNNIVNSGSRGAVIAGGTNNSNIGQSALIGGGSGNSITQNTEGPTILGGKNNTVFSFSGVVDGGYSNTNSGYRSTLTGGNTNTILATVNWSATISGGVNNSAGSPSSTISGGQNNITTGAWNGGTDDARLVSGGFGNTASGYGAVVLNGNTNTSSGTYSFVLNGTNTSSAGDYSFVAGNNMILSAAADRSFLWGNAGAPATFTTPDAFILPSSRMGIRDTDPSALLEINSNGSADPYLALTSTTAATSGDKMIIKSNGYIGVSVTNPTYPLQFSNGAYVDTNGNFMPASSRTYKENITKLSFKEADQALAGLNPVRYNYKNEKDEEYVGFIAEDVPSLVINEPRQGIAPMDIAAVLNKVIQHQQEILNKQKQEREILIKEVSELKNRVINLKNHE